MRVLVTGASGQLGYDVCRELAGRGIEYYGTSSENFDIADEEVVKKAVCAYHPNVVIHCAAWTAVDKAESCPKTVMAVNEGGTRNLAAVCRRIGAKMVYISTDYVFPGTGERFYETEDQTGPVNVYGKSKLAGELAVKKLLKDYFIVRISGVFGENGNNFVKTMLHLAETRDRVGVVCDQYGSPTYTADLAPLLCDMIETEKYGVYHATNEDVCSWADFAREIFRISRQEVIVRPVFTRDYASAARRPLNSKLSKRSLDEGGYRRLPPWKDALERYLRHVLKETP